LSYTIEAGKESGLVQIGVIPRPLILVQIAAINPATGMVDSGSDTVYLTTTPTLGGATRTYGGNTYQARLQSNPIAAIQAQSPEGYDIPGSVSLTIADGDFVIWTNHANRYGWKGGTMTVLFVLYDIPSGTYSSNAYTWTFICDKPNVDAAGVITVAGQARQSLTRLTVPNFADQNRCGNTFPATAAQRLDGLTNPTSPFFGCGYSPDLVSIGGVGNVTTANLTSPDGSPLTDGAGIYLTCDLTRSCGPAKSTPTQGCMARLGSGGGFTGTAWGAGAGDGGGLNAFSIQNGTDLAAIALLVGFPVFGLISLLFGGSAHGAPAGSTSINLGHLLTFSTVNTGDQFIVNGNKYTVTHNFTTDHLGNTPVTFTPPLVSAVSDGTLVYTSSAPDGNITKDQAGRPTGHFTGNTWVAQQGWTGKEYTNGSAGTQYGFNAPNPATGSRYYNQGYGTQWVNATVLAPAGDPNSDRAECIVCLAPVGPASVLKVVCNGVQVPLVQLGQNAGDGLFAAYVRSAGGRTGVVNGDAPYDGQGDPHGSMCWIEVVVPAQLAAAGSLFQVQVLVQFPQCLHAYPVATATISGADTILTLPAGIASPDIVAGATIYVKGNSGVPDGAYGVVGSPTAGPPGTIPIAGNWTGTGGSIFYYPSAPDAAMNDNGLVAANPVWALMDLLTWGPFTVADFDTLTWYNAAQICAAQISYLNINGVSATHARYRCSFALQSSNRMSLAKAVLGLRNCAGIILARNPANGLLQCYIEETLADQQPAPVTGSNYNTAVSSLHADGTSGSGYLAYLFDGVGSIKEGSFKLGGNSLNNTPNTVAFPFQDSANVWVQDSCTTIDANGYVASGSQEIEAPLQLMGIDNFDQAIRMSNLALAKAMYCNLRFDAKGSELPTFKTTVKAAHLASRVGFICGINYEQLGV
jgi:hypothetical protein